MPDRTPDKIQQLIARQKTLAANRMQWDGHWQELGDLFLPRRGDFTAESSSGEKRTGGQFDGVPMQAARGLAATLDGLLKPKSERWFNVRADDDDINELEDVKDWIDRVEDRMWAALYDPRARFLQRSAEVDRDLVVFGTGVLFVGDKVESAGGGDGGAALEFRSFHLRNTFIAESADGAVDTVFRRFTLSARQAVQKFPRAELHETIRRAAEREPDKEFTFLHVVMPRQQSGDAGQPRLAMPFASLWIDVANAALVAEGGFREMPYIVPRWDTATDEIYGRSPAMVALPDAATLNQQAKTILRAGHKAVEPPLLVPNDGVSSAPRTWPGGLTYYDTSILAQTQGRTPVFPLDTGANIPLGRQLQQDSRDQIWSAFFRNALNLPAAGPQMTATEILERKAEFVRTIGPTFGRLEADYTEPLIERVFNVLLRAGAFGPLDLIPPALQGARIRFKFVSPVAKAVQQLEAGALGKTAEDLSVVLAADPSALDHFDSDRIVRDVSDANGVPRKWLRPLDQVAAMRQQRAAAEGAQAQAAAAQQAGATIQQAGGQLAGTGIADADIDLSNVDLAGLAGGLGLS